LVEFNWVVSIVLLAVGGVLVYLFMPSFHEPAFQILLVAGGFVPLILYFLICRMHTITEYAVETKRKIIASYRLMSCGRNNKGYKHVVLDKIDILDIDEDEKKETVTVKYSKNHEYITQGEYAGHFISEDMMSYVLVRRWTFFDIIPQFELIIIPEKDYITFDDNTGNVIIEGSGFYMTEDGTYLVHPKVPTVVTVKRDAKHINDLTMLESYNQMIDKAGGMIRKSVTLNWDNSYNKSIREKPPK